MTGRFFLGLIATKEGARCCDEHEDYQQQQEKGKMRPQDRIPEVKPDDIFPRRNSPTIQAASHYDIFPRIETALQCKQQVMTISFFAPKLHHCS